MENKKHLQYNNTAELFEKIESINIAPNKLQVAQ